MNCSSDSFNRERKPLEINRFGKKLDLHVSIPKIDKVANLTPIPDSSRTTDMNIRNKFKSANK